MVFVVFIWNVFVVIIAPTKKTAINDTTIGQDIHKGDGSAIVDWGLDDWLNFNWIGYLSMASKIDLDENVKSLNSFLMESRINW